MVYYYFITYHQEVFEREEPVDVEIYPQYIPLTPDQVEYHLAHPEAKRYEIEHKDDPIPVPTIDEVRQRKIMYIERYDVSSAVNEFFIDNRALWLDKAMRNSLAYTLQIEKEAGRQTSNLWYEGICIILPIDMAIEMLSKLEIYAKDCYDVTATHKFNVSNLETKEEIEAYDYTVNYPEKLSFITSEYEKGI